MPSAGEMGREMLEWRRELDVAASLEGVLESEGSVAVVSPATTLRRLLSMFGD